MFVRPAWRIVPCVAASRRLSATGLCDGGGRLGSAPRRHSPHTPDCRSELRKIAGAIRGACTMAALSRMKNAREKTDTRSQSLHGHFTCDFPLIVVHTAEWRASVENTPPHEWQRGEGCTKAGSASCTDNLSTSSEHCNSVRLN
jgi:hypothetical protein